MHTFEKLYTKFSTLNYNLSPECEVSAVSKKSEGVIVSCRRGPKTQKPKEYILRFPGIESVGGAARLIGRARALENNPSNRKGSLGLAEEFKFSFLFERLEE